MKKYLLILPLVAALSSCASVEARRNYETAKAELAALVTQFEADRAATGRENQALLSAVKDAETKLQQAREEVRRSKIESVAAPAAQVVEGAAPYANAFAPGAGAVLVALAGFISGLGKKKNGAA